MKIISHRWLRLAILSGIVGIIAVGGLQFRADVTPPLPDCIIEDEVSFPDKAPWGLQELYRRRALSEQEARPLSIETQGGAVNWTATNTFLDLAQSEMVVFKDTKCKNASDYSGRLGAREYVRLTNALGKRDPSPGNYGMNVSYATGDSAMSEDGQWLSITGAGRCLPFPVWCGGGTSPGLFLHLGTGLLRKVKYTPTIGVPDYANYAWGRGERKHKVYWTADIENNKMGELMESDLDTGKTTVVASDVFKNPSITELTPRWFVPSPEAKNGNLLIADVLEFDWKLMPVQVESVSDGPTGPMTTIRFTGPHGLELRDRLRMQGPPDRTCSGETDCDDLGERRVVTNIVDERTVTIADGAFSDIVKYITDEKVVVDVTGFTLMYNRIRQKAYIYNLNENTLITDYFVDTGAEDTTGTIPKHQQGEAFRMHSYHLDPTGLYWGGNYGSRLSIGESISWKFPADHAPTPGDMVLSDKTPCTNGYMPKSGHSGPAPRPFWWLSEHGTLCENGWSQNLGKMSIWDTQNRVMIKAMSYPTYFWGILHARWHTENRWFHISTKIQSEKTNRFLLRCDADAETDNCEVIARGYAGNAESTDNGSIRPKTSPDGTKVVLNTSEFTGRKEEEGTLLPLNTVTDVFYVVSFLPVPPETLRLREDSSLLEWDLPQSDFLGDPVPSKEVLGYHVYESESVTSENCTGPWQRLTKDVLTERVFPLELDIGQSRCYAVTTQEFSGLESDQLGNRMIVTRTDVGYFTEEGGAKGVVGFDRTPPPAVVPILFSPHEVYGVANPYVNGVLFSPLNPGDIRYVNLYYAKNGRPSCGQDSIVASIPIGMVREFYAETGRPYFDYPVDPDVPTPVYASRTVDRAGNQSECSFSDGSEPLPPIIAEDGETVASQSSVASFSWPSSVSSSAASTASSLFSSSSSLSSLVTSSFSLSSSAMPTSPSSSSSDTTQSSTESTSASSTESTHNSAEWPEDSATTRIERSLKGLNVVVSTQNLSSVRVEYGIFGTSEHVETSHNRKEHTVELKDLLEGATYRIKVVTTNAAGEEISVAEYARRAGSDPARNDDVQDIRAFEVSTTKAVIGWITSRPADTLLEFSTDNSYGTRSRFVPLKRNVHLVPLAGLRPNTRYFFRLLSRDEDGTLLLSEGHEFTTPSR